MRNQINRLKQLEQQRVGGHCPHNPYPVVYGDESEEGVFVPSGPLPVPCPCGLSQTIIQVQYVQDWRGAVK